VWEEHKQYINLQPPAQFFTHPDNAASVIAEFWNLENMLNEEYDIINFIYSKINDLFADKENNPLMSIPEELMDLYVDGYAILMHPAIDP